MITILCTLIRLKSDLYHQALNFVGISYFLYIQMFYQHGLTPKLCYYCFCLLSK